MAIRHAAQKTLVKIIKQGERIPFDVAGTRTIFVDHTDLDSAASARSQIASQIKALEEDPTDIETPISTSLDLQSLRQSDDPEACLERAGAFAVIGSFFKELAPWSYESAMEVFRQHISGSETKRRTAEERFREIVETTIESPIMRDLIENDKRSYMDYSMLKEFFMDLR